MKKLAFILLLFPSITVYSQQGPILTDTLKNTEQIVPADHSQVIDSVLNYGKHLIGRRYRYGGSSPSGFDCSGFISYIFRKYGYSFPHSSREYVHVGEFISKDSIRNVQRGDILLFKGRNWKSRRIGHVSIVVEANENEILMLHSCCDKGVAIENYLTAPYYLKRLVGIRRLTGTL